eukprot:TRINITY_DN37819_c0_g1_i1.p2 TRINITY_DN37819_c0_g1~~TRINITY_DN37819_c0_g1_i1.p2  ORF type:complete len:145 (-),score=17.41 TRINITY_DN37819_c0_g1_i1:149-583(-)
MPVDFFTNVEAKMLRAGKLWCNSTKHYQTVVGNEGAIKVAERLRSKYAPSIASARFKDRFVQHMSVTELGAALLPATSGDNAASRRFHVAGHTWTNDVGQLALLCSVDPSCVAFTSTGLLKSAIQVEARVHASSDLYVKVEHDQ